MIIDMMKGKSLGKLIEKHEEYNKELLINNDFFLKSGIIDFHIYWKL